MSQRQLWDRLRCICPRGTYPNGPIFNSQGRRCDSAEANDKAMLDTGTFWFQDQIRFDPNWLESLSIYQETKDKWPRIPGPTQKHYQQHVLGTKDSATGPTLLVARSNMSWCRLPTRSSAPCMLCAGTERARGMRNRIGLWTLGMLAICAR